MAILSTSNIQAYTIRIITPALKKDSPDDVIEEVVEFAEDVKANVYLERDEDNLSVLLSLVLEGECEECDGPTIPTFNILRITPLHQPTAALSFDILDNKYDCEFNHLNVLHNGQYEFDITLQTVHDLPGNLPDSKVNYTQALGSMITDIYSVDICLLFDSERNYPSVGLWAHRVILSRYEKFNEIIQESIKLQATPILSIKYDAESGSSDSTVTASRADSSNRPVIRIRGFSLATISVLLQYIYTGKVVLSVNLNNHVLSSFKASLVVHDEDGMRQETPFDPVSTWKFKDVSWHELLEAAKYYGIDSLQDECEKALIQAIKKSTVMDTIFNIGALSSKVKEAALDFIVENMEMLASDNNPFDAYRDHPDCYYNMFEVMHRSAKHD
ncbi:hypothetical protein BGZ76_000613 [Entomortierella beljakovae]|nr:hypothetical protein BGZ76_000613 [Entomortierella beljakovae]